MRRWIKIFNRNGYKYASEILVASEIKTSRKIRNRWRRSTLTRADRPTRWRGYLLRASAAESKVSIKQKWHANEQKPSRNPARAQVSIISVSRKWFSSPGSCPEDNNWPRESDTQVGYYPTDAPGTLRRTANFKVALGIIPEISMVRYVCGTLVSELLIRDRKWGDKYGKIMRPKTRRSSKRPALIPSFFPFLLRSPITRIGIR